MEENKIPERYKRAAIAHIMVRCAAEAIEFYRRAFNAVEIFRISRGDGSILHAEITVEGSILMLGDAEPPFGEPGSLGGTTVGLHLYVSDVSRLFEQALKAGATKIQDVSDMFYGDRMGMLKDPFGHVWVLLTHLITLTPEEIKDRAAVLMEAKN